MITHPGQIAVRLQDERHDIALVICIFRTRFIWDNPDHIPYYSIRQLWDIFATYIANDYQEEGVFIPDDIRPLWKRCKPIIDKEAAE